MNSISRPRIAIPLPTSSDLAYNRDCFPAYLTAIERSGGEPVTIPLDGSARHLIGTCTGIVLPGSPADVNPDRYAHPRDPATAPADEAREATDVALLEEAERHGKPLLGICYGLQSLNVWRGGSLTQHLGPFPINHAAGPSVAIAHTALVTPDSCFSRLVAPVETSGVAAETRLPINSSHHQAIDILGDSLRIAARSSRDSVIEAVESDTPDGPFLVAVQWHPERSYASSATSRALFDALIAEARG